MADADGWLFNILATLCKESIHLIVKDSDAGKDGGQEEKEATEDKMVRWHHLLNGHEFEQTLGDSEWQGSLAWYSPWDHNESDTT